MSRHYRGGATSTRHDRGRRARLWYTATGSGRPRAVPRRAGHVGLPRPARRLIDDRATVARYDQRGRAVGPHRPVLGRAFVADLDELRATSASSVDRRRSLVGRDARAAVRVRPPAATTASCTSRESASGALERAYHDEADRRRRPTNDDARQLAAPASRSRRRSASTACYVVARLRARPTRGARGRARRCTVSINTEPNRTLSAETKTWQKASCDTRRGLRVPVLIVHGELDPRPPGRSTRSPRHCPTRPSTSSSASAPSVDRRPAVRRRVCGVPGRPLTQRRVESRSIQRSGRSGARSRPARRGRARHACRGRVARPRRGRRRRTASGTCRAPRRAPRARRTRRRSTRTYAKSVTARAPPTCAPVGSCNTV